MNLTLNSLATPTDSLSSKRRLINTLMQDGSDGGAVVAAARNRLAQTQSNLQAQQQLKAQQQLVKQMRQQQMRDVRLAASVQPMPYRGGSYPASTMPMPTGHLGDWIRQAIKLTKHTGMGLAPGIRNMVMHESGGNPRAINNWDSNAARGVPSIGEMQTIQPTFDAYAIRGHTNIYNPVDNIIAGLRYALKNYGHGMVRAGGRHDSRGNYIGY